MKKISIFLSSVLMGMMLMLPASAVNDYFTHSDRMASGAQVRAQQFNNVFDNIVTGLDKLPSQAQGNRDTRNFATATGTANAYVIASALTHITGSYASGQEVVFIAPATNTAASTLNVSSIGASAIVNKDGSAIAAGVIQNNSMVHVRYNTFRSSWELMGAYILSSGVSVSAFASTLLDDADAAAMLVTLGSTPGTVTPSDAVVVDANKDALGFRKITGSTSTGFAAEFTYTGVTDNEGPVYAIVTSATGTSNALNGVNASATGKGVRGVASHATGANIGVYGENNSSSGVAVYASTTVAGGLPIYAISLDLADNNPGAIIAKGSRQFRLNPRSAGAGYNPIAVAGDQTLITTGPAAAVDTSALVLAPHATDAVGIRMDSTTDTVAISGIANFATNWQILGVTVTPTAAEINKLAGTPAGLTSTEIGYLDGVTSAIQTQIASKITAPLTGDVTTSASASTIANDAVSNAKLANMATQTIKGRTTAGTGDPEDLTGAQALAVLGVTATAAELNKVDNLITGDLNFRGALVRDAAVQALTSGSETKLTFTTELYDTSTIHDNATFNTRLTVPSGVTRVKIAGQVGFASNSTGIRYIIGLKNNSTVQGGFYLSVPTVSVGVSVLQASSAVLTVVAGDYFEIAALQNSGGSLNTDSNYTWFSMEIVE